MLFHEHTFFCRSAILRKKELADTGDCRMLTEIPVRDWENCDAVPSTLSALLGVVVPGQLRKVETVFVVSDLQILGISSVKSETDEWLITSCVRCKRASPCAQHPDGSTEKRLAVRLTLADGNSQCSVMLYHELLLKAAVLMEITLPEPWLIPKSCAQLSETCSGMLSGFAVSPSRRTTSSNPWNWSVATFVPACGFSQLSC